MTGEYPAVEKLVIPRAFKCALVTSLKAGKSPNFLKKWPGISFTGNFTDLFAMSFLSTLVYQLDYISDIKNIRLVLGLEWAHSISINCFE